MQSPIRGPSVVVQTTLEPEPPQVKGGANSNVVKSNLIWLIKGLHLQTLYLHTLLVMSVVRYVLFSYVAPPQATENVQQTPNPPAQAPWATPLLSNIFSFNKSRHIKHYFTKMFLWSFWFFTGPIIIFRCDRISRFRVWVWVILHKPFSISKHCKMLSHLLDFWSC